MEKYTSLKTLNHPIGKKNGRAIKNLNNPKKMMNYFKILTGSLNKMEFTIKKNKQN
jgi:hypothetical protein